MATTDRADIADDLHDYGEGNSLPVTTDQHVVPAHLHHRAGDSYPPPERYLTTPTLADDKEWPRFASTRTER